MGAGKAEEGRGGRCEDVLSGVPGAAMGAVEVRRLRCAEVVWKAEYSARRRSCLGRNFSGVW